MKPLVFGASQSFFKNAVTLSLLLFFALYVHFAQAQSTGKTFDSWTVECNEQSICQAIQSVTTKISAPTAKPGTEKASANATRSFSTLVAVRKNPDNHQLFLELPFGIDLAKGVSVMVDGNPSYTLPFFTCYQRGCVVQANLDAKRLGEITSGKFLHLTFAGINTDNWRSVSVPLKGLALALAEIK